MSRTARHPAPPRRAPLGPLSGLLFLLSLALGLGACSDGGGSHPALGDGRVHRLRLEPTVERAEEPSETREVLEPKAGDPRWSGVAGKRADFIRVPKDDKPESRAEAKRIPAFLLEGGRVPASLTIRGPFEPEFNAVLLMLDQYGNAPSTMRVSARRGGQAVAVSEWTSVLAAPQSPRPYLVPLPALLQQDQPLDDLFLEFREGPPIWVVTRVELVQEPVTTFVPGGGTGECTQVLGEESRSGVALSSRVPLRAELTVPADAELRYSFAQLQAVRGLNRKPRLLVDVEVEGEAPETLEHSLATSPRKPLEWYTGRHSLRGHEGRPVRITFRLEDEGDGESWAVVSEAYLRSAGEAPPTVVLITSDTHRGDYLGTPSVRTPVLDALGARGMRFTDALTSTNITNPSHVAVMTGLGPRDTRIVNNNTPLGREALTLAERFREAGFRTLGAASAYHLQDDESGLGQGFDRLDAPHDMWRWGGDTLDRLEDWIEDAEGEPLFVWLHVFDAHAPYEPPSPFDRRYWNKDTDPYDPDAASDLPPEISPPGKLASLKDRSFPLAQYRAGVDYVDATVGELLATPRMADALVAFTSDHGECFGEHGIWYDHSGLYPASVHVPLLLAGPGVPAGVVSDAPVRQYDVAHTLLRGAGVPAADFPGKDLRGVADGSYPEEPRFLLAAHRLVAAINTGRWHLVLHLKDHKEWSNVELSKGHSVELYDREVDPACTVDLSEREFERTKQLRRMLVDWLMSAPASGMGRATALSPEQLAKLEALGYAGGEAGAGEGALFDPSCECRFCLPFK